MVSALNRKLLRDLMSLRAQTATTAILVICGVTLLVSAWSAFNSLRAARDQYYAEYRFADLFGELKRAPLALASRLARIEGVQALDARIVIDGLLNVSGQDEPAVGRFVSVPSGAQPGLNQLYLRKGRLPSDAAETEVVLHEAFAIAHGLKPGDTVSALIQGTREPMRIVGVALSPEYVYALSPAAPLPDDRHFGIIWTNHKGLERIARMEDAFNSVALKVIPGASIGNIITEADRLLKPYGGRGLYGRDRQQSNMFVNDEIEQQKSAARINPTVFLAVAAFLIHVIASRLIAMQRSQIATLKAIGYTNGEVSLHYVQLISVMMLVGAIPGIGLGGWLGQWMAKLYESYFHFPRLDFSLSLPAIGVGLAAGVLPGLAGAWTSIRSAFRLAPAEAMRPPSPPAFHESLLEKAGIQSRLTVRQKMVWRNLLFRPVRLALSILGMSAALAVVVTSGSWRDIIRFLLDTQFEKVQREDLSISLIRPRPTGVLQEISDMSGVLQVEGYRIVPVRVRYRNLKRELALTGWPAEDTMRQRLDLDLKPIPLPAEGILLSKFFRNAWGVRPGELIELEILEGEPRTIQLPVAGFTNDMVGISASMEIHALWKAMKEEPGYNLATVRVDPRKLEPLYVKLKELPEVATVNLKQALYRGFQESMGKVIRVTTMILTGFALAIAFGVIYNSVRVSFSERSWEMASLRVMGFSRHTVFSMLLGEVLIQVLLSLLPGCVLGYGLVHLIMSRVHTETFGFPIIIRLSSYARAILVVLVSFLLGTLVVRAMISRLSLVEALKARE